MTRDDIIRMAREAGIECLMVRPEDMVLHRFATLVAAHEREACCGPEVLNSANVIGSDNPHQVYAKLCAAIRARGNA
jgi:isopropylmalate/homocitrate/citramalate synthase